MGKLGVTSKYCQVLTQIYLLILERLSLQMMKAHLLNSYNRIRVRIKKTHQSIGWH